MIDLTIDGQFPLEKNQRSIKLKSAELSLLKYQELNKLFNE